MTDDELKLTDGIDRTAVTPVVREGVVVLGILALTLLGTALPGAERAFPGTAVTIEGVVISLGTLGIVASLLYAVPAVRDLVTESIEGPSSIVADAAAVAGYAVAFVAVLIAYWGLAPVLGSLIDVPWAYDLAFLLFALFPLGLMAHRFVRALDPIVRFLTAELVGPDERDAGSGVEQDG